MWTSIKNSNTYIESYADISPIFLKYFNKNALIKNKMLISLTILKHSLIYCSRCNPKRAILSRHL